MAGDFNFYKQQLEDRFNKPLKDIIAALYIDEDLGPSMAAKKLGIPRQVFIHYRNFYGLKEIKHDLLSKKIP